MSYLILEGSDFLHRGANNEKKLIYTGGVNKARYTIYTEVFKNTQ